MLSTAIPVLQAELQLAIKDAMYQGFKQTFTYGVGEEGEEIAMKFANKVSDVLSPRLSQSIYNFVMNIDITGSPLGLISPVGPVTGVIAPKSLVIV